jgi:hypothetical protein
MERYAQLVDNKIYQVIESETDPDGVNGEWVLCGNAGPGWSYNGNTFEAPPVIPPEPADLCEWLIDLGPYFDRFGNAKMAVLTSTDAGVKAIIQDASIRKWIDLRLPAVAQALAYIGSVIPAVDATLRSAIVNTPVTTEENRALRKLFF